MMPSMALVWADCGYAGKLLDWAKARLRLLVEIVRNPEGIKTFQGLPRRWVAERTFAWITKCRRLAHDCERLPTRSEAMIKWAMIRVADLPPGTELGSRIWKDRAGWRNGRRDQEL